MNRYSYNLIEALVGTALIALVPVFVSLVEANSVVIGIVRLSIGVAGLGLWFLFKKDKRLSLTLHQLGMVALIGLLFGMHWLSYFLSIKLSNATIGAIGLSSYGIHLTLLSWLFLKERPASLNVLAIVISLIGNGLVLMQFPVADNFGFGLLIGILSGFIYACVPLLHKRSAQIPAQTRTLGQFVFGLIFFIMFIPQGNWGFSSGDWPYLIAMGVLCTLIGHALWVNASTILPIQITSCIFYLGLPFTMLFDYLIIGKILDGMTLVGAALVLGANMLNVYTLRT